MKEEIQETANEFLLLSLECNDRGLIQDAEKNLFEYFSVKEMLKEYDNIVNRLNKKS